MSLYWIRNPGSFRLAIAARPRGGDWLEDDLRRLRNSGVDVLVSMLTKDEQQELGLEQEGPECSAQGVEYLNFAIDDRSLPKNTNAFSSFADYVVSRVKAGKAVAVHCRAGIGRSSLLAASVLIRLGVRAAEAWDLIQHARGCPVPDTPEQRSFVERLSAL